ncbi:MAG: RluA family pseudouridine synthase [Lachnospiraceae bacterium]|jgi:23S rRNA pseudouridine955/2504/2580 synthase|nr:RluA family pseudouridine synthase [Lachnospiraceae bacterium]
MREILVGAEGAGQRLDKYLQKYMAKAPGSFFYKMLRKKNITCNKKKCDGSERLAEGDRIQLFLSEETIENFRRQPAARKQFPVTKLDILYEDAQVLLINKPAGMLSQGAGEGEPSLVEYLLGYLLASGKITQEALRSFRPSICNRLDRNTSGLVTAGKTQAALRELSLVFRERTVKKYYLCLVKGKAAQAGRLEGWLVKNEETNQVRVYQQPREGAAKICTAYAPLSYGNGTTLLKVELITGKTHQIRAHMADLGHPVIGDGKYGDERINRRYREQYGVSSQLLHGWQMEFPKAFGALSGLSGKRAEAPLPEVFQRVLEGEGIHIN